MTSLKVSFCFQSCLHLCYQHWTHLSKWSLERCLIDRTFQESDGPTVALCVRPWWDNSNRETMINVSSPEPFLLLRYLWPRIILYIEKRKEEIEWYDFISDWDIFLFWSQEMELSEWLLIHMLLTRLKRTINEPGNQGLSQLEVITSLCVFQFFNGNYIRRRM